MKYTFSNRLKIGSFIAMGLGLHDARLRIYLYALKLLKKPWQW